MSLRGWGGRSGGRNGGVTEEEPWVHMLLLAQIILFTFSTMLICYYFQLHIINSTTTYIQTSNLSNMSIVYIFSYFSIVSGNALESVIVDQIQNCRWDFRFSSQGCSASSTSWPSSRTLARRAPTTTAPAPAWPAQSARTSPARAAPSTDRARPASLIYIVKCVLESSKHSSLLKKSTIEKAQILKPSL